MGTELITTLRPFTTAGVALVGATAIAITPVALTAPPDVKANSPAVQLTAAIDPITPWLETFNNSEVNFANLANSWLEAPFPSLQQVIANQVGYLAQLPDFPGIVRQIVDNVGAAIKAPLAIDTSTLENTNPLLNHRSLYTILKELGDGSPIPVQLQPLVDFSTTYTSGMLLGLVGPVISPILALAASVNAIVANLTSDTPDLQAAVNSLINTPAKMVDAFLNGGQHLDLTPVLNALGLDLDPGPGTDVQKVGITFGGLLSPGGSIFNALSFDILIASSLNVNIPGNPTGFIGSLIGLTKTIAKALGWDGTGNPLAPPLEEPAPVLREAGDTSILTARTVALETSRPSVVENVSTVDESPAPAVEETGETGSAPMPDVTTPAEGEVGAPAEETGGEAVEEAPAVPVEETPETPAAPVDEVAPDDGEATDDDAAAIVEDEEATDEAEKVTAKPAPRVKANDFGKRVKSAVKSATERKSSVGPKASDRNADD